MTGGLIDVPPTSPVRSPLYLVPRGGGPSSAARADVRHFPLAIRFRRFSGVSGSVGALFSHPFSLFREGDGRACGTALADYPLEAPALRYSGGVGTIASPLPLFPGAGLHRIGNGAFRGEGDVALDPKEESRFSGLKGLSALGEEGAAIFSLFRVVSARPRISVQADALDCSELGSGFQVTSDCAMP